MTLGSINRGTVVGIRNEELVGRTLVLTVHVTVRVNKLCEMKTK